MFLAYKYRLLPTKKQHRALERMLEDQRLLYNAALEERVDCYRKTGKSLSYVDQCKSLTEWRRQDPDASGTPLNIQRWTLRRLDEAFKGFFRRLSSKDKAGFPRFRGKRRWDSFGFNELDGLRFDGQRLRFRGTPSGIRVHFHRALPAGILKSCVFRRDGSGWYVSFQMLVQPSERRTTTRQVGVDVGLSHLATLSTGEAIPNPQHAVKAARELRRQQRAIARCKKGSERRRKVRAAIGRAYGKVANARSTHLHQVSADLVKRFDVIAIEKLNVKGLASSLLAKPVHDASWGRLRHMLAYKAEYAGCELIEVDPRHTSQTCPECGQIVAKKLAQRVHKCDCGCTMDRDHAAALVILSKAVAGLDAGNVGRWPERRHGNISQATKPGRDATPTAGTI